MTVFYTVMDSPIGQITLTCDGVSLTGLYMELHKGMPKVDDSWVCDDRVNPLALAKKELASYFDGTLERFTISLKLIGTEFQLKVWNELVNIPFGQTISYGELACRVGNPKASRAVGLANGQNPISIIVPCHRVIGANGRLTGYGGGLSRKEFLLEHEGAAPAKQLTLSDRIDQMSIKQLV